jgi:surface carbohydrate biosynthesis protein
MNRAYAEGLRDHKRAVFEDFQRLIPQLEESFPDYTIIIRPHPTESHEVYRHIAARCRRVKVTNEGNVVPWLLSAKALIHNGCTTGRKPEMRVPALSYRATVNIPTMPDSTNCPMRSAKPFSFEELQETLQRIFGQKLAALGGSHKLAAITCRRRTVPYPANGWWMY